MSGWARVVWAVLLATLLQSVVASQSDHKYQVGDDVAVWANKIGPYKNPQEYYLFYTLPFCPPDRKVEMYEGLGEAISGYELRKTPIELNFNSKPGTVQLCENYLLATDVNKFVKAVKNRWWYQLFVDDLPVWGNVGEVIGGAAGLEYHIYTHMHFDIAFNFDRIVEVNLTTENPVQLKENAKASFTYSVNWISTSKPFENRFDKYLDKEFFEHQVHTYSIMNSIMLEVFLVVLVVFIVMKTVKKDFNFSEDPEADDDVNEETGWKQLYTEVFRSPRHLISLSASVGIGVQLAVLTLSVLILAKFGQYYEHRGTLVSAFVVCYLFTSPLAGFVSGAIYNKNNGKNWIKTLLITASALPLSLGGLTFLLNMFANSYGSLGFVPFGTMTILTVLWALLAVPLTFAGTIFGRSCSVESAGKGKKGGSESSRVNPVPRQIPEKPWYLEGWINYLLAGVLPFSSIFVELYFVYSSWWHYKFFYVYGMATVVVLLLFITIACITVINTFFLLSSEDYRWQWRSFCSGASVSVFVFLYSVYYFQKRTTMSGTLQMVMYFGYSSMFCVLVAFVCGSVSYLVASYFVRKIYQSGKFE